MYSNFEADPDFWIPWETGSEYPIFFSDGYSPCTAYAVTPVLLFKHTPIVNMCLPLQCMFVFTISHQLESHRYKPMNQNLLILKHEHTNVHWSYHTFQLTNQPGQQRQRRRRRGFIHPHVRTIMHDCSMTDFISLTSLRHPAIVLCSCHVANFFLHSQITSHLFRPPPPRRPRCRF